LIRITSSQSFANATRKNPILPDAPFHACFALTLFFSILTAGTSILEAKETHIPADASLNRIAESYVHLALAMGVHDSDYVDAYFGPEAWRVQAKKHAPTLDQIRATAMTLLDSMKQFTGPSVDRTLGQRRRYLAKRLSALVTRVDILQGRILPFDKESQALYDAVAPVYPESYFAELVNELDSLLPGSGPLQDRYQNFRLQFVIPREKLDTVFSVAIAECRRRTKMYIDLPPQERFIVEQVGNKPWGAYNWFKGNGYSLIQINTDLPTTIDRVINLAAHEGYPGHHVQGTLTEYDLLRKRNWIEFSVYPLFSPQALLSEGTANYGIELVFPAEEKLRFEREVLYPLAGLDPATTGLYTSVQRIVARLARAGTEAARRYLDGALDREASIQWLMRYRLDSRQRAERYMQFIEKYRSYVINYTFGEDLVRAYIESRCDKRDGPAKRWEEFRKLLTEPILPSTLVEGKSDPSSTSPP
jgi:hypothetical protein